MIPIVVDHITKRFGPITALDQISFEVEEGELFGLIGPDGAGKTTLFRILTTLVKPDEGTARVLDLDVVGEYKQIRPKLGYMPGRFSLYQDLSVNENLEFFASVFGTSIEEHYELIKPIFRQLEPFRARLAGDLSGGMKQKLALSCALIHKPEVLVLDEPTTGVDAVSRKEFWEMLHRLVSLGITIIVSTPYMDEAEQCDRIALIQNGRILNIDTPGAVVDSFQKPLMAVKSRNKYRLIQELRSYPYADSVQPFGEYVHYTDRRRQPDTDGLRSYLEGQGVEELEMHRVDPGIEDTFMKLMLEQEGVEHG